MRNQTVAIAVVIVMVLAFLAGLGSSTVLLKGNSTSGSTSNSTIFTCTIPDSGEVIMQVLNSTDGRPIASAPVQVEFLEPVCPPNPHSVTTLSPTMTNGTGYVAVGGEVGDYALSVSGYGYSASASATVGPGQIACITLGIPSGETHVTYTGLMATSMCHFGF